MAFRRITAFVLVAACSGAVLAADEPSSRVGEFRDFNAFPSTVLGNVRKVTILLPPSYDGSVSRRYPVLYAQDGQNLFDAKESMTGREWKLDETLAGMWAEKRLQEIIVVAVGSTKDRETEYMPGTTGDRYVKFLSRELKPFVDSHFRTLKGPADTAIMGSNLGGLISLWGRLTQPKVFGSAAGMSPDLRYTSAIRSRMGFDRPPHLRWYVDMGTAELPGEMGEKAVQSFDEARTALKMAGYQEGTDFVGNVIPHARGTESAWAARLDKPLEYLFGNK